MPVVRLAHETDFDGWRAGARSLAAQAVAPADARFVIGDASAGLFDDAPAGPVPAPAFAVPKAFVDLAKSVLLHRSADRFDLLYRLLWRLQREANLMRITSDPDVADAIERAKNVSRASHKMKAFVRFREVRAEDGETWVSWFEPAHRVLEHTAPFFVRRFTTMRWSILTPDGSAYWNGERLGFGPAARRDDAPSHDDLEDFWRTYYASTFNPARLKTRTMQGEMPKRYWRNLPEAAVIPSLIADAARRSEDMAAQPASEPRKQTARAVARPTAGPATNDGVELRRLSQLDPALRGCRRCDLWRHATQGIPGEGPRKAAVMLVGEQPGDQEDLAGKPFVGPAGRVLDQALEKAGIARGEVYVTNAVKHFKFEPRGKRRMHQSPNVGEINACRWWLEQETRLVEPEVIVALGATAARSVLGRPVAVTRERGQPIAHGGVTVVVTFHPSAILRAPDPGARARALNMLESDLAAAAALVG